MQIHAIAPMPRFANTQTIPQPQIVIKPGMTQEEQRVIRKAIFKLTDEAEADRYIAQMVQHGYMKIHQGTSL